MATDRGKSAAKGQTRAKTVKKSKRRTHRAMLEEAFETGVEFTALQLSKRCPEGFPMGPSQATNFLRVELKAGGVVPGKKGHFKRVAKPEAPSSSSGAKGVDPVDPGTVTKVPDDQARKAREALFASIEKKASTFTLQWVQENVGFFSSFTWGAIGAFLANDKVGDDFIFEKSPPSSYRLTICGHRSHVAWKKAKDAPPPRKASPKKPSSGKKGLLNGLSNDPAWQRKILEFLVELGKGQPVVRAEFYLVLREKFGWGEEVHGQAIGRVVFGLMSRGLLSVMEKSGKPDVPHKKDLLTLGSAGITMLETTDPASGKGGLSDLKALRDAMGNPTSNAVLVAEVAELRQNLEAQKAETARLQAEQGEFIGWLASQLKPYGSLPRHLINKAFDLLAVESDEGKGEK